MWLTTLSVPAKASAAYVTVAATSDPSAFVKIGFPEGNNTEANRPFNSKPRYPYEITLNGASVKYRPITNVAGRAHGNGGGFVANTATVAASVFM